MISALILAAGQSKRMGKPKMALAWASSTILGHIIGVLRAAGMADVLVVTGGDRAAVEAIAASCKARTAFNASYADQEMLSSLQVGLRAMPPGCEAVLMALGDQPQIQEQTVRLLIQERQRTGAELIVPSYEMRRGHPWLVARGLWDDILAMQPPDTARDFLQRHADRIHYVTVDTPTILRDIDTPEDYSSSQG